MRLLFIKVPKTGSTFFEKNFKEKNATINGAQVPIWSVGHSWLYSTQIKGWRDWDFSNQKPGVYRDVDTFKIYDEDRLVTIVRNPFALLFSYFNYDWSWCRKFHNLPIGEYKKEDFQKFVDIYLDKSIVFHAPALRNSLFSQLKDGRGNWVLKEDSIVLRFENLKEDIENFSKMSGIKLSDLSDTAKNTAKDKKPCEWWEAYRDDQIQRLNELWRDDLEYFNYSFAKPQQKVVTTKTKSKPKIAICFSGQLRDLERTKDYWTSIIKKYDMDVYASIWDVENKKLGDTVENFHRIYDVKKVEVERFDTFENSTLSILRMGIKSPNSLQAHLKQSCSNFGTMGMWYKVWRANLLTKELGIDYDIVIRTRTDIIFDDKMIITDNNMLNVPYGRVKTSDWPNSDGIADLFAYGKPKVMDYYSTCLFFMMEHINNGHYMVPHEHFLHTHLNKVSIPVRFMDTNLRITRTSKGTPDEIYHKGDGMKEEILQSDFMKLNPSNELSFKDDIKKNFKV